MGEEGKKISFGFSKLKKSSNLVKPVDVEKEKVQYVDAFDGKRGKFSYKGAVHVDGDVKKVLVIPLVGTRNAYDVIKEKLDQINDDKVEKSVEIKEEPVDVDAPTLSIEAQAAAEILRDLKQERVESISTLVIPQAAPDKPTFVGEKESTIEDYDNVPVADYGLAMLRGMGWKPDKGIGKNERVVQPVTAKLRPKGLGLGADQAKLQATAKGAEITLALNSYVTVSSGPFKGAYGQVTGVDGDCGRMIVKLAMGDAMSLSELILTAIDKKEYDRNSKVLNAVKYAQYLDEESKTNKEDRPKKEKSKSDDSDVEIHRKNHRKSEKDKSACKVSSESSTSTNSGTRRKKKSKKKSRSESRDGRYKKKKKDRDFSSDSDGNSRKHEIKGRSEKHSRKKRSRSGSSEPRDKHSRRRTSPYGSSEPRDKHSRRRTSPSGSSEPRDKHSRKRRSRSGSSEPRDKHSRRRTSPSGSSEPRDKHSRRRTSPSGSSEPRDKHSRKRRSRSGSSEPRDKHSRRKTSQTGSNGARKEKHSSSSRRHR